MRSGDRIICDNSFCKKVIGPDMPFTRLTDGRIFCIECFFQQHTDLKTALNAAKRWLETKTQASINDSSFQYQYVDAQEMGSLRGIPFIPTPAYDHPCALGLYTRLIPRLKPFLVLGVCALLTFGIIIWGMSKGMLSGNVILPAIAIFLGLLFLYSFVKSLPFIRAEHRIFILSGNEPVVTEGIIAHELAHFIHFRRTISAIMNNLIDHLLSPFLTSYSEGFATWVEYYYMTQWKARPFDINSAPIIYRNGFRLIRGLEKLLGEKSMWFLLKYV